MPMELKYGAVRERRRAAEKDAVTQPGDRRVAKVRQDEFRLPYAICVCITCPSLKKMFINHFFVSINNIAFKSHNL